MLSPVEKIIIIKNSSSDWALRCTSKILFVRTFVLNNLYFKLTQGGCIITCRQKKYYFSFMSV